MVVNIEGELIDAIFVKRINRFVAEIEINGNIYLSHVPNTGRMKELLTKGAKIIVRKVDNSLRKTNYDLLMVYHKGFLVSIDSKLPNKLLYNAFINKDLKNFKEYHEVNKEVNYKNSRIDIALKGRINSLVEAKCVTLVDNGVAKFPDAPTERGTRHVLELIDSIKENFRAYIIFIVQREDADSFTPNKEIDKEFYNALVKARDTGVEIKAIKCKVSKNKIVLDKEIEVIL